MKRKIKQRIKEGQAIEEIWVKDGEKMSLFKKKV